MAIAALITFAILLVAWIAAPSAPRSTPAPEMAVPEAPEPMAA